MLEIPQQPVLFDTDLERMHVDLYKGKYLTPQEFLDDVGKIVHNAGVMMNEDPDRLFKAQAMFTAAQVSIQDFDPGLRLECDRMASRERRRREEHRKSREKGKSKADDAIHAVGTRRSARNNGQQPELTITDPLKLERKLKRQRSNEAGADSHGSSEENGEDRVAKRSKVSVSDDDDRDPLDIAGPTSSQPRPPTVHFANDIKPMSTLEEEASPMNGHENYLPELTPSPSPHKIAGLDHLLNPVPPSPPTFPNAPPLRSLMDAMGSITPIDAPVSSVPHQDSGRQPFLHAPVVDKSTSPSPVFMELVPPIISTEEVPNEEPMLIERTPTPLPEFHVDASLINNLRADLRDQTGSLTIEQLEQLRATCLGCVWRHRTEWNRDALVNELNDVVKEFVAEVAEDLSDSPLGEPSRW